MSNDLTSSLRKAAHIEPEEVADLMAEAADSLEAAREDACVGLLADIRWACGDKGKRMQPELVEFIRELAVDAERYRWLRDEARTNRVPHIFQYPPQSFDRPQYPHFKDVGLDAAIDSARGIA